MNGTDYSKFQFGFSNHDDIVTVKQGFISLNVAYWDTTTKQFTGFGGWSEVGTTGDEIDMQITDEDNPTTIYVEIDYSTAGLAAANPTIKTTIHYPIVFVTEKINYPLHTWELSNGYAVLKSILHLGTIVEPFLIRIITT